MAGADETTAASSVGGVTAPANDDHDHQPATRWLVLGLAVMAVLAVVLSRQSRTPSLPWLSDAAFEIGGHIAVAFVLALVMTRLIERSDLSRPALAGVALVVLATTLVEIGQVPQRDRSASVSDLIANTTGAVLGGSVAAGLRRLRGPVAGAVVLATMVVAIGGGAWATTADFDPPACGTETSPLDGGSSPAPDAPQGALQYSYDLSATERDGMDLAVAELVNGPALVAASNDGSDQPITELVFGNVFLRSDEAGRSISTAVTQTDRLFVEVAVTPTELTSGPGRIMAVTAGTSATSTNVHVGQHRDQLSVRLRLTCGEFNWTLIDDVFVPGERRHIVVTFADATQRVWVDGVLIDQRRFTDDVATTANWVLDRPLVVGNTPGADRPFHGDIEYVVIAAG